MDNIMLLRLPKNVWRFSKRIAWERKIRLGWNNIFAQEAFNN